MPKTNVRPSEVQLPDWNKRSDEQLAAEYQRSGDASVFSELMLRYERPLHAYLSRFLGNETSADDVLQNTFLQLHLRAATIDTSRRFRPWLYMVAKNQALDYFRRNRRHQALSLSTRIGDRNVSHGELLNDRALYDECPSPQEALEAEEERDWVRREADGMSDSLREVFVRTYIQGLKLRETAVQLDLPLGTVKSRIHSARDRLRKRL